MDGLPPPLYEYFLVRETCNSDIFERRGGEGGGSMLGLVIISPITIPGFLWILPRGVGSRANPWIHSHPHEIQSSRYSGTRATTSGYSVAGCARHVQRLHVLFIICLYHQPFLLSLSLDPPFNLSDESSSPSPFPFLLFVQLTAYPFVFSTPRTMYKLIGRKWTDNQDSDTEFCTKYFECICVYSWKQELGK